MIIAIDKNNYKIDNVFLIEQPQKNISDTNFIRLIYSSKNFSLNGIYISLNIINMKCEN